MDDDILCMDDDILSSSSDIFRIKTYHIHPLSETHAQYTEGALIKKERDENILKYFSSDVGYLFSILCSAH